MILSYKAHSYDLTSGLKKSSFLIPKNALFASYTPRTDHGSVFIIAEEDQVISLMRAGDMTRIDFFSAKSSDEGINISALKCDYMGIFIGYTDGSCRLFNIKSFEEIIRFDMPE